MTDLQPVPEEEAPAGSEAGAQAAEATGQHLTVEYAGRTYTFKPATEWPGRILRNARTGMVDLVLEAVLGADQFKAFDAADPTLGQYGELFNAIAVAAGFQPGESGASPSS